MEPSIYLVALFTIPSAWGQLVEPHLVDNMGRRIDTRKPIVSRFTEFEARVSTDRNVVVRTGMSHSPERGTPCFVVSPIGRAQAIDTCDHLHFNYAANIDLDKTAGPLTLCAPDEFDEAMFRTLRRLLSNLPARYDIDTVE